MAGFFSSLILFRHMAPVQKDSAGNLPETYRWRNERVCRRQKQPTDRGLESLSER